MVFKVTVVYSFDSREEYQKFYADHIDPLFLKDSNEMPTKITSVSLNDLSSVVNSIEELIKDEDCDMYSIPDMVDDIITKSFDVN